MKVFTIQKKDINSRLDCFYYLPDFIDLEKKVIDKTNNTLGDYIIGIAGGATPRIEDSDKYYTDDPNIGIPFLRVQNVHPEGLKLDDIKYITPFIYNNLLKRSQVSENNLIIKITGVGRMAISSVAPKGFKGNINQHLVVIKTNNYETSKVLATFLNTDIGEKLAKRRSTGGTRPALDYQALKNIPIIYKPEIVKIMDDAYSKKKLNEKKAEKLINSVDDFVLDKLGIVVPELSTDRYFTAESNRCINNRFDVNYHLPKFNIIQKSILNSQYTVTTLKEYIDIIRYGVSIKNDYFDKGIPLLRILNLKPNHLELDNVVYLSEDVRSQIGNGFVREGDLLISRSGSIGNVAVVTKVADGFAFGSFMIKIRLNSNINQFYVSIWLNNKLMQELIQREKIGAIQGNITIPTIENFIIPIPPKNTQEEIVNEFLLIYKKAKSLKIEAEEALNKAKKEVEKILFE